MGAEKGSLDGEGLGTDHEYDGMFRQAYGW